MVLGTFVLIGFTASFGSDGEASAAEPSAEEPAGYTYDYLVDGSLPADIPAEKKYKTIQAAYAAAPAGTEQHPTVIGIMPNVYHIQGTPTETGLNITKNYITLLGLTDDRRKVVLADNRGNKQGAGTDTETNNGYVVIVKANGFTAKNLTFLNYTNMDYEYPGDPSKNLKKRSDVETQAVALQASGDKHVYENVAFLSRLDTLFLQTTRAYCKNCYLEGTADFLGGGTISVWEDSEIHFAHGYGPVMAASGVVFIHTKFTSDHGVGFYKGFSNPVALIDCTLPVFTPATPNVWGTTTPIIRNNLYSLTYHTKDTAGNPAQFVDSLQGEPANNTSRELSDEEALAFNPWNLLRATPTGAADDWDPAGVKEKYADQGDLIFRMAITNGTQSIRTGDAGVKLKASVSPTRAPDQTIAWSTDSDLIKLSSTTGPEITVTGNNRTENAEYVTVRATAVNGFYVTAHIYVEPEYIDPPTLAAPPVVEAPSDGKVRVDYTLDNLGDKQDQSVITWYISDDANGTNAREVATSRGDVPLREYTLTPGDVGKYIRVGVEPKHQISVPGPAVFASGTRPIKPSDLLTLDVSPNFRNFVTAANDTYVSGLWTVDGDWTSMTGGNLVNGYGVRAASQGAALYYQQDKKFGNIEINAMLTPEKTGGQGFGSPGSGSDADGVQNADIFIKYDPRTETGYSLRFWRTTESAEKVKFQLYKIDKGIGMPISDTQVLTGVLKPNTYVDLKVIGNMFTVTGYNDADDEVLSLQEKIVPNRFGGAGIQWSGTVKSGNSLVISQFDITYPKPGKAGHPGNPYGTPPTNT